VTTPAGWPRRAPIAFDDTTRLIPGTYTEGIDHSLAELADDDDERDLLLQLAAATNSRLQAQEERHPAGLSREDMVFGIPYSKIINAAFANPGEGARFHAPGGRGVWYCARDIDTSLAEVAHHRVRHLAETGLDAEEGIPYRLFLADVHAQDFYWLDDTSQATKECLDPHSYTAGQQLGARIVAGFGGGVVYPSVRHRGGTCVAVFAAPLVSNLRQGLLYYLTIANGSLVSVRTAGSVP
jgi:RES domain-containing protein